MDPPLLASLFQEEDPNIEELFVQDAQTEETLKKKAQPLLRLYNDTPHKIVVRIGFQRKEPGALTLISQQGITILNDEPLVLFKVTIYGRYRKYLTAEKLSLGWVELHNHATETQEKYEELREDFQITIQLGANFVPKLLQRVMGEFVPYKCICKPFKPEMYQDFKKEDWVLQTFPQVKEIRRNNLNAKVLPRYVLCVPEHATATEIIFAYTVWQRYWIQQVDDSYFNNSSPILLLVLEAAYNALAIGDIEAFDQVIKENELTLLKPVERSL